MNMKRTIITLLFLIISVFSFAQSDFCICDTIRYNNCGGFNQEFYEGNGVFYVSKVYESHIVSLNKTIVIPIIYNKDKTKMRFNNNNKLGSIEYNVTNVRDNIIFYTVNDKDYINHGFIYNQSYSIFTPIGR